MAQARLCRASLPSSRANSNSSLGRVVHLILDRMRRVLKANDFLHLELGVAVEEIVIENPAGLEEITVLLEIAKCLAQRAAHGWNLLEFLGRQIIKILVDRRPWIELVPDTIESRHQHRREGEIWIGQRIGVADLDALPLRRGGQRNPARCRAVANGICQQHGRFETWHKRLIRIRGWVGASVYVTRILEN